LRHRHPKDSSVVALREAGDVPEFCEPSRQFCPGDLNVV
jgi:hypothetical protein